MFKRFKNAMPAYSKRILILFENSGHIEDATIEPAPNGEGWIYCLFDGETLNDEPTHWEDIPGIES